MPIEVISFSIAMVASRTLWSTYRNHIINRAACHVETLQQEDRNATIPIPQTQPKANRIANANRIAYGLLTGPDHDRFYTVALEGPGSDNLKHDETFCTNLGILLCHGCPMPNDADASVYISVIADFLGETEAQKFHHILSLEAFYTLSRVRKL